MAKVNNQLKISIVLLGNQRHINTISALEKYKSKLFKAKITKTIGHLEDSHSSDWAYSKIQLRAFFNPTDGYDITIGIIDKPIEDNYFMRRLSDNCAVVTFYEADEIMEAYELNLLNYLLKQIYELVCLFQMHDNLIPSTSHQICHDDSHGCIFDMDGIKTDIRLFASKPILCDNCRAKLNASALPKNFVEILSKELKRIRKDTFVKLLNSIKKHPIKYIFITFGINVALGLLTNLLYDLTKNPPLWIINLFCRK